MTVMPLGSGPGAVMPFFAAEETDPVESLFENKQQLLADVTQPLTITQFAADQPVRPVDIDSVARENGAVLGFSPAWQDSLARAMKTYQKEQGYKYFDAAASHVLTGLNIYNQEFLSLSKADKEILGNRIVNPQSHRLTMATYTKLPSAETIAASGTEKLHAVHWQTALNFSVAAYADKLAKAAAAGDVTDSASWQSWNRHLLKDKGYIPGAGGHPVELGAYAEQRWGLWAEEHQKLRGVHEGRHGPSSDHYAHKFIQQASHFSEAIDIFGPGRQYGRAITARLDSFYHYQVLPHRDLLGVPRVLIDEIYSKAEKAPVNPGRAVWELRGHYGDHVHVSMAPRYAMLYAGDKAMREDSIRQDRYAYFNRPASLPVKEHGKVALRPEKNIIVINRDSVIALDPAYPSVLDVRRLKQDLLPKPQKKRKKTISFQENIPDSYRPAGGNRLPRNVQVRPAVHA